MNEFKKIIVYILRKQCIGKDRQYLNISEKFITGDDKAEQLEKGLVFVVDTNIERQLYDEDEERSDSPLIYIHSIGKINILQFFWKLNKTLRHLFQIH